MAEVPPPNAGLGILDPHATSLPEELKRAEHVETANLIRATFEEGHVRAEPTASKPPAERPDVKEPPRDITPSRGFPPDPKTTAKIEDGIEKPSFDRMDGVENADDEGRDGAKVTSEEANGSRKCEPDGDWEETAKQFESREQLMKRMEDRMNFLEKELRNQGILDDPDEKVEPAAVEKKAAEDKRLPAIPKLRRVEWEEFKHKYSDEKDVYAIEILIGEARYYHQRTDDEKKMKQDQGKPPKLPSGEQKSEMALTDFEGPKGLPERMRINSEPILSILAQIDSEDEWWGPEPTVILRPFKPLIFYRSQIRDALGKLEARWGEAEKLEDAGKSTKAVAKETTSKQTSGLSDLEPAEEGGEKLSLNQSEENSTTNGVAGNPAEMADGNEAPSKTQTNEAGKVTVPQFSIAETSTTQETGKQVDLKGQANGEAQTQDESQTHDESKLSEEGQQKVKSPAKNTIETKEEDGCKDGSVDLTNSVEALRDLRCLVDFIDTELLPVVDRYRSTDYRKVSFADLWHLFKPGDLMYAPLGSKNESEIANETTGIFTGRKTNDRIQDAWRIVSTAAGRPNLQPRLDDENDTVEPKTRVNPFLVLSYYVDFDGSKFGALTYKHFIQPYKGERNITSLAFYPLRFAPNQVELRSKWLARGEAFKDFMTPKHKYYFGRSLVVRPTGLHSQEDDLPKHAEHIDSQVVIDFNEALSANPSWTPCFLMCIKVVGIYREFKEEYPVTYWRDRNRMKVDFTKVDYHHCDHQIDEKMAEQTRDKDCLIKDTPDKSATEEGELSEEHLILLPNRVFAFVMKNRKFALLTVDGLRDINAYRDGFRDLKLPGKHKTMVSSLVHNHFHNKKAEINDREVSHDSDIVRGKGKGLIVLLHGAPGVGKTSTAETVAEAYRKPLFPITCGDLGLTAAEVERELEDKFHLAELWDCVLLLDEADVFLAQRTRTDVKRNSLVSVFLRVLEYFTGILFLTTNRVGAFDEAFKSRIHISLYYPPLDWNQTLAIWEMNMGRLRDKKRRRKELIKVDEERLYKFAKQHYQEKRPKNAQWNGRQIRNAFQTATALAEFEAHEAQSERKKALPGAELLQRHPELRVDHFEVVAHASSEFDKYLFEVRGVTDARRAFMDQERADQYQPVQRQYPRKAQQPPQAFQGMPLTQQDMPTMPLPQGQRSARTQQQYLRQQPSYINSRQQHMRLSLEEDVLSEEEEDGIYGQPWQEPPSALPQSENPDEAEMWRREPSPQRQQPRSQSAMRRDPYMVYPNGPRDY